MEKTLTSLNSWQSSLNLLLKQCRSNSGGRGRVAIIGIGNELRADDAAGMLVAKCLLMDNERTMEEDSVMVIQAGTAPENAIGQLRSFNPQLILLVDAAEMGELPGTIQWIAQEGISGMSASTHGLPLSMLSHYLTLEFNCEVALLGIQPASNDFGRPVSSEVVRAVDEIVIGISDEIFRAQFPMDE